MDEAIATSKTKGKRNARLHQIAATGKQSQESHIYPLRDSVRQAWQSQRHNHQAWDHQKRNQGSIPWRRDSLQY